MVFLALVLALGAPAPASATGEGPAISATRLKQWFRAATGGDRLARDPRSSWDGVTALVLAGGPSLASTARYGRFTVYVFRPDRVEEVERLLADVHTAAPIEPDARGIRWEHGSTLYGEPFWTAKTLYGPNVVLVWDGGERKRVTRGWQRLHRILAAIAS